MNRTLNLTSETISVFTDNKHGNEENTLIYQMEEGFKTKHMAIDPFSAVVVDK